MMNTLRNCISCFFLAILASNAATVTCRGDGKTDVSACLQNTLWTAQQHGDVQVFLPKGNYGITTTIVIPDRIQLIGVGPGNGTSSGSAIVALNTFPLHGVMVEMGVLNQLNFGVQIQNLTIDGGGRADIDLQNLFSMEQSYGEDLQLTGYLVAGLDVEGSPAQNSGPFKNLTITPGPPSTVTSDTGCVIIRDVISFRGLSSITCNGGTGYVSRPGVAMQLDGQALYTGLSVSNFATALTLGSSATSADGMVIMNASFGPNVDTAVVIESQTPSQNLSLFGINCSSCSTTLNDTVTDRISSATVGWYLLGNGAGVYKKVLSSDQAITDALGNYENW
jgi:hypothetical protein